MNQAYVKCFQPVVMSWFAVILNFDYLNISVFIKIRFMLQVANSITCHPKAFICSDQFQKKIFYLSWKLPKELYYKDRQISKRPMPRSMPNLLPCKKDKNLVFLQRREYWQKGYFNKAVHNEKIGTRNYKF